jgi:hypothetical protein
MIKRKRSKSQHGNEDVLESSQDMQQALSPDHYVFKPVETLLCEGFSDIGVSFNQKESEQFQELIQQIQDTFQKGDTAGWNEAISGKGLQYIFYCLLYISVVNYLC